ncbi:MAG: DnaA/Hda family protein [Alphaproteobacteria bacterium]|nr:DnaA/Hda family protein [Alphaproteobacteria bacterium]
MCAQQIPFALPVEPSMGEDDFLITPSNQTAAAQLNNDSTTLLLGPKGTGKSHLARIWQKRRNAFSFNISTTTIGTLSQAVLWEDADATNWNAYSQETAFHLLNTVKEKKLPLLVTATKPPAQWDLTLADLRSRLLAINVATIDMPDDALVAGLLLKHFKDRQLRVSEDVLNYIIPRIARDGAVIEDTVKQLDVLSLANNHAITIPLIKKVLESA